MSSIFALPVITQVPIGTLKPSPNNARTHSKRQIEQIAKSMERFGFNSPIVAGRDNIVRVGHGRLEAAKQCGLRTVPVIYADHLSEADLRAFALADNRLALEAGWDPEILAIELQELQLLLPDLDLTITGFEIPEIDLIIGEAAGGSDPENEPDAAVSTAPPISQLGDIWQIGYHRLICGNALDPTTYTRLLGDQRADLVFCDPPYNVPMDGHATGKGKVKHREFAMASGEMDEAEFRDFLRQAASLHAEHSKPGSVHFWCMDWRHYYDLLHVARGIYDLINTCVWVKDNGGLGGLYRSQHEFIAVFKKPGAAHRNNVQLGKYGRNRTNVWNYPGANSFSRNGEEGNLLAFHPTVKPVGLIGDALLDCSAPGELVLDGFLGSGSTLIAAERTRRHCYGIEIDPGYVDVAIRRWQQLTKRQAIHADSQKPFDDLAREKADA